MACIALGPGAIFVDVQATILDDLPRRLVIPLEPSSIVGRAIPRLNPVFAIDGSQFVLLTDQMVSVPTSVLNTPVTSLQVHSDEIMSAIDFAFLGF
ncbi:MAG: CcdB family protein [Pseudomonadota bacterium]